jgi:hypothetical protein
VTDTGLADLVDWAASQLPQLMDQVLATIIEQIELYHTDHVVPREDLQRSVENNLRYMVAAMRDPEAPRDFTAPQETGRRRARQGAPLPELLRAYRIGFTALWDLLAERARRSPDPNMVETLLSAASTIWRLTDEYAMALTESYRAATTELLVIQQQRRGALAEALFTGEPGPDAGPWEVSQLLGLRPDGDFVVIAAETSGPAEEGIPQIERRLSDRRVVSAWWLTPGLQMGVTSLRTGQLDQVLAIVREHARSRVGVSPVYHSLRETSRALHLARIALTGVPAGRAEVNVFSASPLAAMVANDPDEANRLADQVLGAVLELPAEDRAILLDTLQAWFDHAGSADRAAQHLYCHPNTVRYRLHRLHELTGRSLSEPYGVADLSAALLALRLRR